MDDRAMNGRRAQLEYPAAGRRSLVVLIAFITMASGGCIEPIDEPSDVTTATVATEIISPIGVEMIALSAGEFEMGNGGGAADEQPVHHVKLDPFVMDRYEVTQDQYAKLQLPDPSHFKGEGRPVEQVRWSDAALFCNERSRAEGLEPCYDEVTFACDFAATGYRLPTEAEWEFAARAGEPPTDGDELQLKQRACYTANAGGQTSQVGKLRPNAWGFYDLQGNVSEWCNDIYAPDYYAEAPELNPTGPTTGKKRVVRGGNWSSAAQECRLTARTADDPGISDACFARDTFGFRCVRKPLPNEIIGSE